jgi:transketolase
MGWAVRRIDGHDMRAVKSALAWAKRQKQPSLVACRTKIGKGAPSMEGHHDTHGKALGKHEVAATRINLGWAARGVRGSPGGLRQLARGRSPRGQGAGGLDRPPGRLSGGQGLHGGPERRHSLRRHRGAERPIQSTLGAAKSDATRAWSGAALEGAGPHIPEMIGGSADLTGSNNTRTKGMTAFDAPDYAGRYVHYGVRELGMAAAMNGMALHGGLIPYSGTFLVFSDYSRPAIRLAALMGVRVIHVLTHDSIGLGEDGPTHQPVEHLAALRAIPNLLVFRPADGVEAGGVLARGAGASLHPVRHGPVAAEDPGGPDQRGQPLGSRGLRASSGGGEGAGDAVRQRHGGGDRRAARERLQAEGVATRVVSVPCFELFEAQDSAYQAKVLGKAAVRIAIEAGVRQRWDRFIGPKGSFIGMSGFGASGSDKALYEHFGITPEAVVAAARAEL